MWIIKLINNLFFATALNYKDTAQSLWEITLRQKSPIFCTMLHFDLVNKCVKDTNLVGPLLDHPRGVRSGPGPHKSQNIIASDFLQNKAKCLLLTPRFEENRRQWYFGSYGALGHFGPPWGDQGVVRQGWCLWHICSPGQDVALCKKLGISGGKWISIRTVRCPLYIFNSTTLLRWFCYEYLWTSFLDNCLLIMNGLSIEGGRCVLSIMY